MVRAVVFDLDGVLADTERLQWQAYRSVLLELGVDVGLEEYRTEWIRKGYGPEYACRTYRLPITPDELRARKAPAYLALIRRGVEPVAGAREAVARLKATHRLALATNTGRDDTRFVLEHLGVRALLDAVVAREDYVRPKPEPDAYLAAAAALGVAPGECAVVEDTERGARAGRAAGMRVIALPSDLTFDNDFTGCVRRLAHLDELTAELLAAIG
jgi:HAD superfamily hydrolase (TIGR01509 family)